MARPNGATVNGVWQGGWWVRLYEMAGRNGSGRTPRPAKTLYGRLRSEARGRTVTSPRSMPWFQRVNLRGLDCPVSGR